MLVSVAFDVGEDGEVDVEHVALGPDDEGVGVVVGIFSCRCDFQRDFIFVEIALVV